MVDLPIDYTSRDYTSIRLDMLNQVAVRLPEWTSAQPPNVNENDLGVVLIELFAHIADSMHYYADRVANEAFMSTASQRASVLEIARLLDYAPTGNGSAVVNETFLNSTASPVTIPKRTRVGTTATRIAASPGIGRAYLRSSAASVVFETRADLTVPAHSSAVVQADEGIGVVAEAVATSDGTPDQDWDLYYAPVVNDSVVVYINGVQSQFFGHLVDADDSTPGYALYTDATGYTHITFGDGVNGSIPPSGATITADYRIGGGSIGNVVAGTLVRTLTTVPAGVTAYNFDDAAGGSDAESITSIKTNAPRSLYTLDRAVSAKDYAQLALKVPGVGKAALAPQSNYNNAVLYIAPSGGRGLLADQTPTPAWFNLRDAVDSYMVDRIPASTTLTILPPTYVTINGVFSVVVAKNYPLEATRLSVYPALESLLLFDNVSFGDSLGLGDFLTAILSVPGIIHASATLLAPNAPNVGEVVIEDFDSVTAAMAAAGWSYDPNVGVELGSLTRTAGTGSLTRTFAAKDLSRTGQITLRYTYDGGPSGGLTADLTLTDVNGNSFAAGQRTAGVGSIPFAHTALHNLRWNDVTFPNDSTIFDATHVTSYLLKLYPHGAAIPRFWVDDLRATPYLIEDIPLAFNEIPIVAGNTSLTAFTVSATRG